MKEVKQSIESHPRLREWLREPLSGRRLGGLTNKNFLVDTDDGSYVLRIPGDGTEAYIDRASEGHAAGITAELGVNAPLLYFDVASGVQLCRYLDGATTMNAEKFRDVSAVARAAASLRRVHECRRPFQTRFELFAMLDSYLQLLAKRNAQLPAGFLHAKQQAEGIRTALATHPLPLVPCHCDPLAENFLDTGRHMFVVDWEYAGNNDAMWDLADLSVEACFSAEQDDALLASYFYGGTVHAFDRGRMILYKAMCDLLWTLWGIIQHTNGNPAEDFWAYAAKRFERCQTLMQTPGFAAQLGAVVFGPSPA